MDCCTLTADMWKIIYNHYTNPTRGEQVTYVQVRHKLWVPCEWLEPGLDRGLSGCRESSTEFAGFIIKTWNTNCSLFHTWCLIFILCFHFKFPANAVCCFSLSSPLDMKSECILISADTNGTFVDAGRFRFCHSHVCSSKSPTKYSSPIPTYLRINWCWVEAREQMLSD